MSQLRAGALLAAGLTATLALAGCSAASDPSSTPSATTAAAATPVEGGTYIHAFSAVGPITSLDPPTLIFHEALQTVRTLTSGLVDQDPKTGKIVPWVATSWKINSNSTVFTFHLKPGATFSDGTPIHASAVKANFDRDKGLGPKAVGAAPAHRESQPGESGRQ